MNRDVYEIDFCNIKDGDDFLKLYQELQIAGYSMNIKVVETEDEKIKNNPYLLDRLKKIKSKIEPTDEHI